MRYCFRAISFFLSLFLCRQHYEKTAGPICMKFSGKVWSDNGTTWLNFGSIWVNGSAGQRSVCLLSAAIAQRTGVNKSVSFARWQQGRGLLCLSLQLVSYSFVQLLFIWKQSFLFLSGSSYVDFNNFHLILALRNRALFHNLHNSYPGTDNYLKTSIPYRILVTS